MKWLVILRSAVSLQIGAGFSGKTETNWASSTENVVSGPQSKQQPPPQRGGTVPDLVIHLKGPWALLHQ